MAGTAECTRLLPSEQRKGFVRQSQQPSKKKPASRWRAEWAGGPSGDIPGTSYDVPRMPSHAFPAHSYPA